MVQDIASRTLVNEVYLRPTQIVAGIFGGRDPEKKYLVL